MALAYLLNPCDQYQSVAGVNNVGGYFEVFLADTDDRATVYVDFEGTLAPARIPIDMNGRCVMVVDAAPAYRVEMHDRSGNLIFTQSPVNAFGGGTGGGSGKVEVKSSDGSLNVTKTTVGDTTVFDIGIPEDSVDGLDWIRCDGSTLEDGFMRPVYTSGTMAVGVTGVLMGADRYYHVTAHIRANKGLPENIYDRVSVEFVKRFQGTDTVLQSATRIVDYSFGMVQEFEVSGDFLEHSEFELCVRVAGLDATGGTFELLDLEVHRVYSGIDQGKNIHRLLRWYTGTSDADAGHPAGDWLHDLDAVDESDPSGHPMVTADQLFDWYAAGQVFDLYEIDSRDGRLGWSAVYRMVAWEDQSDWWSQEAPVPGKAVRIEFFRMGVSSTPYRGGLIAYIRYRGEDYMRLYPITPGQSVWVAEYQEKLTPGTNITIEGNVISAPGAMQQQADWTETDTSAVSFVKHKPTVKPVEAGTNITITEGSDSFVISSSGASEAQVAALAEQVASLADMVDRLTGGVNRMQDQVSHWAYEMTTMQGQVNTMQTNMNSLNSQYLSHGIAYDESTHTVSHQL
jgi:hypothetical protein